MQYVWWKATLVVAHTLAPPQVTVCDRPQSAERLLEAGILVGGKVGGIFKEDACICVSLTDHN